MVQLHHLAQAHRFHQYKLELNLMLHQFEASATQQQAE
jgi:hypothetical protein